MPNGKEYERFLRIIPEYFITLQRKNRDNMKFTAIIPARYASTRFPGKPLAMLGGKTVIDLIGDATVASSFKKYFPAGDAIAGKTEALLDFSFMYDLKYDMGASTNVFTLSVTDKNGKNTVTQVKFKK